MTTYTTEGTICGECGHKHQSLRTAVRCLKADRVACNKAGGYSDRRIVRTDGHGLTYDEIIEMNFLIWKM